MEGEASIVQHNRPLGVARAGQYAALVAGGRELHRPGLARRERAFAEGTRYLEGSVLVGHHPEAEEPLRGDLDVRGLRAQVLRRIEELEEREKELLLAGVTELVEEHGLDVGPLRAVLGS